MKTLKIKYLDDSVERKMAMPRNGDVGIDLYASESVFIPKGEVSLIELGIAAEIPEGYWLYFRDRSSVSKYCQISAGIIDSSYRGPLKVRMFCHTSRDKEEASIEINSSEKIVLLPGFKVEKGDKIAQMIICRDYNSEFQMEEVTELSNTERGSGGFGSTGKK